MMNNKEQRWIEVQFYFILWDIWKLHNKFKDILDFVKCVQIFNDKFNESRICSLAQDALLNRKINLNPDEYLVLCWIFHAPIKTIRKYHKIYNLTITQAIQRYMNDPDCYYFYPRNPPEDVLEMKNFVDAVEKMKGVGITWTTKSTKHSGKYSNRLEPKPYR